MRPGQDECVRVPIRFLPFSRYRFRELNLRRAAAFPSGSHEGAEAEAMTNLAHAVEIAEQAHAGQTDKAGEPYIEHLERVAASVDGLDEKIVAYLHDLLEKGE